MATSLSCGVSAIPVFCWPTTQTPSITNCLVAVVHIKLVIAILVPKLVAMATSLVVAFGQGSSLLWTHTLRPFYSRPTALTQEGRSLVNDVCECVRD